MPGRAGRARPARADVRERAAAGDRACDCRRRPQDRGAPAPAAAEPEPPVGRQPKRCPKCGCDDESMLEDTPEQTWFCNICAHEWGRPTRGCASAAADRGGRPVILRTTARGMRSVEALIAATGVRRDELATLAEIGALNSYPALRGRPPSPQRVMADRTGRASVGRAVQEARTGGPRPTHPAARLRRRVPERRARPRTPTVGPEPRRRPPVLCGP